MLHLLLHCNLEGTKNCHRIIGSKEVVLFFLSREEMLQELMRKSYTGRERDASWCHRHIRLLVVIFIVMIDFYIVRKGSNGSVHACYLHGTDSGECTTQSLDTGWLSENMPYCQIPMLVIPNKLFPVCIPKTQVSSSNNPLYIRYTDLV